LTFEPPLHFFHLLTLSYTANSATGSSAPRTLVQVQAVSEGSKSQIQCNS